MTIKPLYSLSEVALLLGMSKAAVRRLVDSGELRAERMGHKLWIPIASLRARASVWDAILLSETYRRAAS